MMTPWGFPYPFPCKGCEERTPGCHASCRRYADAKADFDAKKTAVQEAEKMQRMLDDIEFSARERISKAKDHGMCPNTIGFKRG